MFELNLASLPNHILYLEGVQLSYIKVFVHIFNLWQSDKPCFISTAEFCQRTGLHRATVFEALNFFERNKILKRVQKGNKRYLVQPAKGLEIEVEAVDKSGKNSSNDGHGSELDDKGVGVRRLKGSELDDHNNKYNNKNNKSFCENAKRTQKAQNEKRHDFESSMNQMACEDKAIAEHENRKLAERSPMPENLKNLFRSFRT